MGRTISLGMTGSDVRALQDVLNYQIRRGTPLNVDGIFGPKTQARVREFQQVNGLDPDGLVGLKTQGQLYEVTQVTLPVMFMPRLQLPEFRVGRPGGFGIQPPRLIPPLQWPGPPFPAPPPFKLGGQFQIAQNSFANLPTFTGPANALGMKLTVPTRKDPLDPSVRSRQAIVELIEDLPVNSKFKAFLVSKIPNTVEKIEPPETGFKWGVEPHFNPLDPKGFGVGGNARFTVRVSEGRGGLPSVGLSAWGDAKVDLDFESKQGQSRPRVEVEGSVFFGVGGTF